MSLHEATIILLFRRIRRRITTHNQITRDMFSAGRQEEGAYTDGVGFLGVLLYCFCSEQTDIIFIVFEEL